MTIARFSGRGGMVIDQLPAAAPAEGTLVTVARLLPLMRLEVVEARTHFTEEQLARELDCHGWRIAAYARDQRHLHHFERLGLLRGNVLHRGRDRPHEAVGDQDAEKRADQRG